MRKKHGNILPFRDDVILPEDDSGGTIIQWPITSSVTLACELIEPSHDGYDPSYAVYFWNDREKQCQSGPFLQEGVTFARGRSNSSRRYVGKVYSKSKRGRAIWVTQSHIIRAYDPTPVQKTYSKEDWQALLDAGWGKPAPYGLGTIRNPNS